MPESQPETKTPEASKWSSFDDIKEPAVMKDAATIVSSLSDIIGGIYRLGQIEESRRLKLYEICRDEMVNEIHKYAGRLTAAGVDVQSWLRHMEGRGILERMVLEVIRNGSHHIPNSYENDVLGLNWKALQRLQMEDLKAAVHPKADITPPEGPSDAKVVEPSPDLAESNKAGEPRPEAKP